MAWAAILFAILLSFASFAAAAPLERATLRKVLQVPDPCKDNADCGQDPCLPVIKGTIGGRYCVCDGGYENGGYLNGGACPPTAGAEAPVGTLVSVWETLPAKNDSGKFWGPAISEYAWFSVNPQYSLTTWLIFRLKAAFVVGPNNSKTYLKPNGTCFIYQTDFMTTQALYDSCKGSVSFPADVDELAGFWALLEAPAGQVIQVQQPFTKADFSVLLSSTIPDPKTAKFIGAEFDSSPAPDVLSSSPNVQRLGLLGSAAFGPFTGSGLLTFQRLTLKVAYTGASVKKGDTLSWNIPYTAGQLVGAVAPPKAAATYLFNLPDLCKGSPCGMGGRCVAEGYTGYKCVCMPGFLPQMSATTCVPAGGGDPYSAGF